MSRGDALESWRLVYTGQRSTQGQLSMCAFKPPTDSKIKKNKIYNIQLLKLISWFLGGIGGLCRVLWEGMSAIVDFGVEGGREGGRVIPRQ